MDKKGGSWPRNMLKLLLFPELSHLVTWPSCDSPAASNQWPMQKALLQWGSANTTPDLGKIYRSPIHRLLLARE